MALGAQPVQVRWLFGLTLGIAGAIGIGTLLEKRERRTAPMRHTRRRRGRLILIRLPHAQRISCRSNPAL
jgi:hypothetical protein